MGYDHESIEHELHGDDRVLINNKEYIRFEHHRKIFSYGSAYQLKGIEYEDSEVFLRQESQKIYRLVGDQEFLLYDFDLNLGDTIQQFYVDSIFLTPFNNEERRVFILSPHDNPGFVVKYFYEGIGSSHDFLDPEITTFESGSYLECYKMEDDVFPIIQHNWAGPTTCNSFLVSTQDINYEEEITLYPNPADDHITLTLNHQMVNDISCFNINQEELKNFAARQISKGFEIDISQFTQGCYFIVLKTTQGVVTKKFIKI